MNTRPLLFASIVSSTLLLALAGCGKSPSQSAAEAAVAAATGGKVQVNQSGDKTQMTVKDDKGNEMHLNTGGNVPLPKDFPSDIHLPNDYTIKTTMTVPNGLVLELHAPATLQVLYADYDTKMKAAGWTEAMAMQSSDKESMLTFTKGKRNVVVSLTVPDDGGTDVHLQAANEAN